MLSLSKNLIRNPFWRKIYYLKTNPAVPLYISDMKRFNSNMSDSNDIKIETSQIVSNIDNNSNISWLSDAPIVRAFDEALINIHDWGSFEWSTTIVLAALAFRVCVCFPIGIFREKIVAKSINVQPEILKAIAEKHKNKNLKSMFISKELKKQILKEVVFSYKWLS